MVFVISVYFFYFRTHSQKRHGCKRHKSIDLFSPIGFPGTMLLLERAREFKVLIRETEIEL